MNDEMGGYMSDDTIEIIRPVKKGRPPKPKSQKRDHIHSSAYTQEESQNLVDRALGANLPPSIFQREAALNARVVAKDIDAGLRLGIYQEMVTQLRYCRAELRKVERNLAERDKNLPAIIALRAGASESLRRVDELMACLTIAFRKELGLDPD